MPKRRRAGFTLIELLVVLLIVSIIAAVTLPVVLPAIAHRQVSESARIIQGGLVAARDAALRTNSPHGIRFLPDPANNGITPGAPGINPFKTLASNRFIPIEQPPGYSEGSVFVPWSPLPLAYYPHIIPNQLLSGDLYPYARVRMICQAPFRQDQTSGVYYMENPTSWYWNVRVGDKIQLNQTGPYFTIVGPMDFDNPEKFVNVDPANTPLSYPNPSTGVTFPVEILFVVNGVDDDGDGYIDNGMDGIDNDQDGSVDNLAEWSEKEAWPAGYENLVKQGYAGFKALGDPVDGGIPYRIARQPVVSPGSRETALPDNVVVDLTSWNQALPERSRLPVDPLSGTVDILLDPSGRLIPTTRYSSPASFGMNQSFRHIWVGERSDLAEVPTTGTGATLAAAPLVSGGAFLLPMPRDAYDAYDPALVNDNPTLPVLKGQVRLLTLSTRTGNLITTDTPAFDVTNPSRPYHAPQLGRQGDAP